MFNEKLNDIVKELEQQNFQEFTLSIVVNDDTTITITKTKPQKKPISMGFQR